MTEAETATVAERPDVVAFSKLIHERRGGPNPHLRLLGLGSLETLKLLDEVEAGFSFKAFERFQRNIDLSMTELATLVQIAPRTLLRRKAQGRLSTEESDRLLRASRVFGKALALFEGDAVAARSWFSTPVPALGERTPRAAASTEVGAREVENLVGRLEHGVFS